MVAAVVSGLCHRHLQVVRIRFLLHLVRIAVSRHTLCSTALLEGIGQVLNRGLQQLVPVGQTLHGGLHLLGIAAAPVDDTAQAEHLFHHTAQCLDTAGQNAHRPRQVYALQPVQRLPHTIQPFAHPFGGIDAELLHQPKQVFRSTHIFLHLAHTVMQRVRGLGQSLLLCVPRCIQRSLGILLLGFCSFPDSLVVGFLGFLD